MRDDTSVFIGSDNVFADLGLANSENLLAKAKLTAQIQDLMEQQGLTDAQAALRMGVEAKEVDRLLSGDFDDFTFDRLFHFLNRLGRRVEIHLLSDNSPREDAALTVIAA